MLYERVPTTDDHRGDYENAAQENVTSDLTNCNMIYMATFLMKMKTLQLKG